MSQTEEETEDDWRRVKGMWRDIAGRLASVRRDGATAGLRAAWVQFLDALAPLLEGDDPRAAPRLAELVKQVGADQLRDLPEALREEWIDARRGLELLVGATPHTLVEGLLNRQSAAFQRLAAACTHIVEREMQRKSIPPSDLEELTQRILIRADDLLQRNGWEWGRIGGFRKWFAGVSTNIVRDYLKERKRDRDLEERLGQLARQMEDPQSEESRRMDDELLVNLLDDVRDVLAQRMRGRRHGERDFLVFRQVLLAELEDQKVDRQRVAQEFGMEVDEVYQACFQIRREVRKLMIDWGIGPCDAGDL